MIIDISHHQKDFPFAAAKSEVDFWIVRPSHGINETDGEWADNLAWLKAHPDEPFSVYHYFYYQAPAQHNLELQNFLNHILPLKGMPNFTGIAFLDFEHPTDVGTNRPIAACTPQAMTDYLVSDCAVFKHQGFKPGLYASKSWLMGKMQPARFPADCVIWLAHYTGVPLKTDYPNRYDLHQYASNGSLTSTTYHAGALDLDAINPETSFASLAALVKKPLLRFKLGDVSDQVADIQKILKSRDYDCTVDKSFGPKTLAAVKAFQTDQGIDVDGIVGPVTWDLLHSVREFSLSRDGNKLVRPDCPNFYVREFACKDGTDKILVCLTNVKNLQKARDRRKLPMHINSGYRTATHNAAQGGETNSLHLFGYAADYYFDGVNPAEEYAVQNSSHHGGVGKYASFTHLDSGRNRRWNG